MNSFNFKPIFQLLDSIIKDNSLDDFYKNMPKNTADDKMMYYAKICQNELLYVYHMGMHDGLAVKWHSNTPDIDECARAIQNFYITYSGSGKDIIDAGLESRNKRRLQQTGQRYTSMKRSFYHMFPKKYCFKCGSTINIQIDHIKGHNSFKHIDLAYNIDNLQFLCSCCNQEKGSKTEDYRTPEQKKHVKEYIKNFLKGDPIIKI